MSTLSVDTIQGKTTAGTVAMPAGMVIQTTDVSSNGVGTVPSSRTETASTTFVATNLFGKITPKFSNSKVTVRFASSINTNTNSTNSLVYTIYRSIGGGSFSNLRNTTTHYGIGQVRSAQSRTQTPFYAEIIDSPSTTSEVIYKVYVRSHEGITAEIPSTTEEHYECIIQEIAQ
jgi:hypothetical protein